MKKSFKINGMSCKHCVATIENGLDQIEGIEKVKVNLRKEKAEVKFDENQVSTEKILAEIKALGYEGEEWA